MNPVDSPHVLLTRAADALEECASKATPGPWEAEGVTGSQLIRSHTTGDVVAYDIEETADAVWIATLSPAVAPLVAWLRNTADRVEVISRVLTADAAARDLGTQYAPALAVLGIEAETS